MKSIGCSWYNKVTLLKHTHCQFLKKKWHCLFAPILQYFLAVIAVIVRLSMTLSAAKVTEHWHKQSFLVNLYGFVLSRMWQFTILSTPYMVLPLFATRFTAYTGGIRVSSIQLCLIWVNIKILYRLIWMKIINMLSMYVQSGTHRRFN